MINDQYNDTTELAVTHALRVLLRIYQEKPRLFELALLMMAAPFETGRDLAVMLEVSPSTVCRRQYQLAADYPEIRDLLKHRRAAGGRRGPRGASGGGSFREEGQTRGGAGRLDASTKILDKSSLDNLTGGARCRRNG